MEVPSSTASRPRRKSARPAKIDRVSSNNSSPKSQDTFSLSTKTTGSLMTAGFLLSTTAMGAFGGKYGVGAGAATGMGAGLALSYDSGFASIEQGYTVATLGAVGTVTSLAGFLAAQSGGTMGGAVAVAVAAGIGGIIGSSI